MIRVRQPCLKWSSISIHGCLNSCSNHFFQHIEVSQTGRHFAVDICKSIFAMQIGSYFTEICSKGSN